MERAREIQKKLRVRATDRRTGLFKREQVKPQQDKPTTYILERQGWGLPHLVHDPERKAIADARAQLRTAHGQDIRIKTERVKVAQDGHVVTKEVGKKVVEEVKFVDDKSVDRYERKVAAKQCAENAAKARQEAKQRAEEAKEKAKEIKKLRKAAQETVTAAVNKSWDRAKEFESANMEAQSMQGEPNGSGFTMGWARILMAPRSHVKDALSVNRSTNALTADFRKALTIIRDNGMDPENRRHGALEWAVDALKAEAETTVGLGMKWLMKKFTYVNLFVNGAVLINQWSSSDLTINKISQGINDTISTLVPLAAFVSDSPTFSAASDRQQDRIVYGRVFGGEDILDLKPGNNTELAAYQRRVATAFVSALEQQPSHFALKGHELGTQLQQVARPLVNFEQSVVAAGKKFGIDIHKVAGAIFSEATKGSDTAINYSHILGALDTLKTVANQELDRPQSLLSYTVNLKDAAKGMVAEETLRVKALEAKKPFILKRKETKAYKKELKAARLAQAKWAQAEQIAGEVLRVYQKASQLVKQAA